MGYQFNTFPAKEAKYTRYLQLHNSENTAQMVFSVTESIKGEEDGHIVKRWRRYQSKKLFLSWILLQPLVGEVHFFYTKIHEKTRKDLSLRVSVWSNGT